MRLRQDIPYLIGCVDDQRRLADAATDFSTRLHHRRMEAGFVNRLKIARAADQGLAAQE